MRRILTIAGLLFGLTAVGTIGFRVIENAPWLDCLYMSVITLTTVGFEHTIQPHPAGKVFIICYLVLGLGVFTYSASQLGQWIVSVQMRSMLERRRMNNAIAKLKGHYVVCGCGRMGEIICEYLHRRKRPFVLIDIDEEVLAATCEEHGWLSVVGDATDDEVLRQAGIERATALATVLPTDADNVYVVLTARIQAANLQIIARATDEKAIDKMERAGATRVVSPYTTGATRMARFMLTPSVEDFLEITDTKGTELELADVQIDNDSPYVGRMLSETDLRSKGLMVIGIRRDNGDRLMPPPGTATIEAGDSLFIFGSTDAVNQIIARQDAGPATSG